MRKKWIGLTLGAALLCAPAWAAVLWAASFEGGVYPATLAREPCGDKTDACGCDGVAYSMVLSTQYKREGFYSGKSTLSKCHERAEWREITNNHPAIGASRYYGFSLKTPSNFDTNTRTFVHQFIQYYGTEENPMPSWANSGGWHHLKIEGGQWIYRLKYSVPGSPRTIREKIYNLGPVTPNAWTDFVVYGVWRPDNSGRFQVWIRQPNDPTYRTIEPVYQGSTMLDIPKAPYFKIGLYRGDPNWPGVNAQDSIFIDSVRAGTTFNEVIVP